MKSHCWHYWATQWSSSTRILHLVIITLLTTCLIIKKIHRSFTTRQSHSSSLRNVIGLHWNHNWNWHLNLKIWAYGITNLHILPSWLAYSGQLHPVSKWTLGLTRRPTFDNFKLNHILQQFTHFTPYHIFFFPGLGCPTTTFRTIKYDDPEI